MTLRVILATVVLASSLRVTSTFAAGSTKEMCIAAHVNGQDLRRAGNLSGAMSKFEFCAADACPGVVREDCVRRLAEVQRARPTVMFIGKTAESERLPRLRIGVDGAAPRIAAEELITLEPGEHRFDLVAEGFAPMTKRLTLLEGMHIREEIVFSRESRAGSAAAETESSSSRRTISYVVGGVGLASLVVAGVLGGVANGSYREARDHCGPDPRACQPGTEQMLDDARDQRTTAFIFAATGAVLVVGALVVWLTAPSAPSANSVSAANGRVRWFEFD